MSDLPSCLEQLETLSHSAVFEALQKEFSPFIDSTLVAALLADIDFSLVPPIPSSPSLPTSISYATAAASNSNTKTPAKSAVASQTQTSKKKKRSKNPSQSQTNGTRNQKGSPANTNTNAHTAPTNSIRSSDEATKRFKSSLVELYETLKALAVQAELEAGTNGQPSEDTRVGSEIQTPVQEQAGRGEGGGWANLAAGTRPRSSTNTSSKKNGRKTRGSKKASITSDSIIGTSMGTPSEELETESSWTGNTFATTAGSSSSSSSSPLSIAPSNDTEMDIDIEVPADVLSFLQAALPQISTRTLKNALGKRLLGIPKPPAQSEGDLNGAGTINLDMDLDMWAIISNLLASQDTREMDERGLTAFSSSSSNFSSPSEFHFISESGEGGWQDEEKTYQTQLEEDEKLARQLAAQFEEEDRPKAYRKGEQDGDEWVVTGKKKKQQQKTGNKVIPATNNGTSNKMTIKLNDLRQQNPTPSAKRQSQGAGGSTPTPDSSSAVGTATSYREALAALLPSLASYLSSILQDKSPSALLGAKTGKSAATKSKSAGGPDSSMTYIQNVFLNEKAVTLKYEGKVYLAVRACLEKVVEVLGAQAEEEAIRRRERELVKEREQEKEKEKETGKQGMDTRKKEAKFPPEDTPRPPHRKAKNRVRTAKDRSLEREREPGESEERSSSSGSVNDSTSVGQGDEAQGEGEDETKEDGLEGHALLFNLLNILLPKYAFSAGPHQQYIEVHQLLSDIELCIAVTSPSGRPSVRDEDWDGIGSVTSGAEDALDLAILLCELYVKDADPEKGVDRVMGMFADGLEVGHGVGGGRAWRREGVSYAATVGTGARQNAWGTVGVFGNNVSDKPVEKGIGNRPVPSGVALDRGNTSPVQKKPNKPSPYQWQAVPVKKAPAPQPYTILPHLPTYTRDVNGIKVRGDESETNSVWVRGMQVPGWDPSLSTGNGRRAKASEYEAAEREYRHSIKENMRRRDELLREAARMYNRGTVGRGDSMGKGKGRGTGKVRGGDIAWYFADRAREFQEAAKKESLNAARVMVLRKQAASGDHDTIDLHGTTVNEAVEITLEILESRGRHGGKALKIVTGRGLHSVNGTSVLKPALKKRLVEEGWSVGGWDAGLVVR